MGADGESDGENLIDQYYTGKLLGKVPKGWTVRGWIWACRERLARTDDKETRDRLIAEIKACKPKPKAKKKQKERTLWDDQPEQPEDGKGSVEDSDHEEGSDGQGPLGPWD